MNQTSKLHLKVCFVFIWGQNALSELDRSTSFNESCKHFMVTASKMQELAVFLVLHYSKWDIFGFWIVCLTTQNVWWYQTWKLYSFLMSRNNWQHWHSWSRSMKAESTHAGMAMLHTNTFWVMKNNTGRIPHITQHFLNPLTFSYKWWSF